ncbi:MAG: hypothetical protein IJL15_02810 [Clostridia bacterium]|jgi:hypothetical protein|nr:hypothetical protein [Clostridia bacterium]
MSAPYLRKEFPNGESIPIDAQDVLDAGIVLPEYDDVRRPGYNYRDPHAPSHIGEPKRFPEIRDAAYQFPEEADPIL